MNSKELEALEEIRVSHLQTHIDSKNIGDFDIWFDDLYSTIKQTLTPPTEEEVCEALEQHYKKKYEDAKVRYEEEHNKIESAYKNIINQIIKKKFIASFFDGRSELQAEHVIVRKTDIKSKESKEIVNRVTIQNRHFPHPPHLITIISRFFEGVE